MEIRLKDDILRESKKFGDQFLVHDESSTGLITKWQDSNPKTVLTPREVYEAIESEGYKVKYFRIPVTDERAPEPKDFDDLLEIIKDIDIENTHVVYNCQMGRGRTTTGTIIASLVSDLRLGVSQTIKSETKLNFNGKEQNLLEGNYKLIQKLMRVLENANENKSHVDFVIDNCSQMQNLRTAIYEFKLKGESNPRELERSMFYLERYFLLIVFNEFLIEQMKKKEALKEDFKWELFSEWLNEREEILGLLSNFDLE
jgi:protein-tyrosine phosphatase